MSWFETIFPHLAQTFGVKFFLSPLYILATVLIVWVIWARGERTQSFATFMLPKALYRHPSTMMDIKLALFNTLFLGTGVVATLLITPWVTIQILDLLSAATGHTSEGTGWLRNAFAAVVLFLAQDFCRYWNHYLHHEHKYLWPFHAVHHSAEVMTPITFMRAHPMYSALQALMISAIVGTVQALILFAVVGQITPSIVYFGTLAFNIYVFFGGHLRHSHVWLSYGRKLEHILISPAQHQVHHSSDPKHHDKNYGEIFAFWDWMFGTLYVPDGPEDLTFGIADRDGVRIPQPHPTMRDALVGPFEEVWEEIVKGTTRDKSVDVPAE